MYFVHKGSAGPENRSKIWERKKGLFALTSSIFYLLSSTLALVKAGWLRTDPMTGSLRRNAKTRGKKSLLQKKVFRNNADPQKSRENMTCPKRLRMPKTSMIMPTMAHLKKTRSTPNTKHRVPRIFCFCAKNPIVR